jgi:hypothetical protein
MGIFQNATLAVTRKGASVAGIPPVRVQIDLMSQMEAAYYGGEQPYFRYNIFTVGVYPIEQADLLTDTKAIDPVTGTNKQYRVINDPATEQFLSHVEVVADRYRGT